MSAWGVSGHLRPLIDEPTHLTRQGEMTNRLFWRICRSHGVAGHLEVSALYQVFDVIMQFDAA